MTSGYDERPASEPVVAPQDNTAGEPQLRTALRGQGYASGQAAVRPRATGASPQALAQVPTEGSEGVTPGQVYGMATTSMDVADALGQASPALRATGQAAEALDFAGNVTGAISLGADVVDMMQNGINVQNGVNFIVDAAGAAAGSNPVVSAFCAGYAVGQLLDDLIGISDWVGSFANGGHAGGDLTRLHAIERLASQGDQQCARLLRLYEQLADYEDAGAGRVNDAGVAAAEVRPEWLQAIGREQRVSERAADLLESGEVRGRLHAGLRASMQTPLPDTLRDRIEEEGDILDDRIEEARDLVRALNRPRQPAQRTSGTWSARPQN